MGITLPALTPLEDSLWLTLRCRALDNRRPHRILADAMADQMVHRLDYDVQNGVDRRALRRSPVQHGPIVAMAKRLAIPLIQRAVLLA